MKFLLDLRILFFFMDGSRNNIYFFVYFELLAKITLSVRDISKVIKYFCTPESMKPLSICINEQGGYHNVEQPFQPGLWRYEWN